jgi:hypothetical protein
MMINSDVQRLKELEKENNELKQMVANFLLQERAAQKSRQKTRTGQPCGSCHRPSSPACPSR